MEVDRTLAKNSRENTFIQAKEEYGLSNSVFNSSYKKSNNVLIKS